MTSGFKVWLGRGLPILLAVIGALIVIALSFQIYFEQVTVGADLSTYLLPAVAREQGLGLVYKDFLDIKPPLTFGVFVPWIALFGSSLASMWAFYALLLALMFTAFFIALYQQLRPWLAVFVFGFCVINILFFTMLEEFFFVTEVVGSVLVLWGLVLARWRPTHLGTLLLASLLLGAAGQVKDVFVFAPLALLPIVWAASRRLRAFGALAAGVASAYVLTGLLLIWWGPGALQAYWEIIQLKRERFPLPTPTELADLAVGHFSQLQLWFPWFLLVAAVLGLVLVVNFLMNRNDSSNFHNENSSAFTRLSSGEWMLVFFFGAMYLGFLWQGAPLLKYFAVAMVFPIYLLVAVLISQVLKWNTGKSKVAVVGVTTALILGLSPAADAVLWAMGRTKTYTLPPFSTLIAQAESPGDLALYTEIQNSSNADDCLQVAYGWSATADYLYALRPACTRFTLPPLVAQTPALWDPLATELLAQPPGIIIFDPTLATSGTPVFPYAAVLARCYRQSDAQPILYFSLDDEGATRGCMQIALAGPN